MAIRLIVTITATPGNGAELARAYARRCREVLQEPGCEQFEIFRSVEHPDRMVLMERWTDQAALDVHAGVNSARPPMPPHLRSGQSEREDYTYNRTR
jgi:quinol monooxygenase YgiN